MQGRRMTNPSDLQHPISNPIIAFLFALSCRNVPCIAESGLVTHIENSCLLAPCDAPSSRKAFKDQGMLSFPPKSNMGNMTAFHLVGPPPHSLREQYWDQLLKMHGHIDN